MPETAPGRVLGEQHLQPPQKLLPVFRHLRSSEGRAPKFGELPGILGPQKAFVDNHQIPTEVQTAMEGWMMLGVLDKTGKGER